jgi:N-acetylmuramoyl-L-alanine amidase
VKTDSRTREVHKSHRRLLSLAAIALLAIQCSWSRSEPRTEPGVPTPIVEQGSQSTIVCLDPGHPSEVNSGATIQNGTSEVHIAWAVALKVRTLLEARGIKVVMTKTREDQLVRNKDRALFANDSGASLMVRLHCDAGESEGFALYVPDRQAKKEGITGPSQDVIERSWLLAGALHTVMANDLKGALNDAGVRGDSATAVGSKQGALTASIFSTIPIVTIEMVVLSNKSDAEFIKSDAGQQRMSRAIADGILAYISSRK